MTGKLSFRDDILKKIVESELVQGDEMSLFMIHAAAIVGSLKKKGYTPSDATFVITAAAALVLLCSDQPNEDECLNIIPAAAKELLEIFREALDSNG
jgi:hypothetical protein